MYVFKTGQKFNIHLGNFCTTIYVTENFQRSPNLVTLVMYSYPMQRNDCLFKNTSTNQSTQNQQIIIKYLEFFFISTIWGHDWSPLPESNLFVFLVQEIDDR